MTILSYTKILTVLSYAQYASIVYSQSLRVAGVVQCEAHDRLVTFASPIVERIWNGHDLSHMATTRYGASFGQDSHTRSKRQGSALHVKVSRKVPPGHMDLSGSPREPSAARYVY